MSSAADSGGTVHAGSSLPSPDGADAFGRDLDLPARVPRQPGAFERPTFPERIAASLRERIAMGDLAPGTRLIETDLMQVYGVSRHAVREAVILLTGERLLTRTSYKGVEITRLRAADVRDIYAARRAIELPAVDALPAAPPEILAALWRSILRLLSLPESVDSDTMHLADAAIHTALVAAHGSRRLSGAHATLMAELQILLFKTYGTEDRRLARERHAGFGRLVDARDFAGARAQLDTRLRRSETQMALACID